MTYTGTLARFIINGHVSPAVVQQRGLKEGCPLSPVLFVLCIEPLLFRIRTEVPAPGRLTGVVAFADDVNPLPKDPPALGIHLSLVQAYEPLSGLGLNASKCVLVARSPTNLHRPPQLPPHMTFYTGTQAAAGVTPLKPWASDWHLVWTPN